MFFFKTKIFILFMLIVAGATFYYFGDSKKLVNTSLKTLEKTPLKPAALKIESINGGEINVGKTAQDVEAELLQFSTRAQEVKKHTDNILGAATTLKSSIEATQDATPLHEKVLEYGKYVYCKSVVNDYEAHNELQNK